MSLSLQTISYLISFFVEFRFSLLYTYQSPFLCDKKTGDFNQICNLFDIPVNRFYKTNDSSATIMNPSTDAKNSIGCSYMDA